MYYQTKVDGDEKVIKCKCCVAKGTNILILRKLWFEAIDHLNRLSSRSKDKDNPVTSMATTITQPTKPSTEPPRTSELSTDSVSIELN
uniref:Uncharacterized protein n=1 Tax=Tetranychus urticae TaxID=32264 RepID=T1KSS2_TETUR